MREMCLRVLRKQFFLLFSVGEVAAILGFLGTEIDRDPSGIANKVDEARNLGLHRSDTLNARRAVANHCDTLVGPIIGIVPRIVNNHFVFGAGSLPCRRVNELALEIR